MLDPTGRPEPFAQRPRPRRSRISGAAARDALAGHARGRRLVARRRPRLPPRARRLLGGRVRLAGAGGGARPAAALPRPVGGLGIHFVHAAAGPPPRAAAAARHGWPDSFWRYTKVIPLLTDPGAHGADPADAFDVVVPDMPGFGYSERPAGPPLDSIAVAGLWAELMGVLGYERFGAAGGDIGSHVSRYLGARPPRAGRRRAPHRGGLPVSPATRRTSPRRSAPGIDEAAAWGATEGAYAAMQRTKPQTAAAGLTDSPAGLAAWIVEKLRGLERLRRRHRAQLHQGRDPHERHDVLAHRHDRFVDAHVPRQRRDPARPACPPGRGAVRLLALPRRHPPAAAGVARTNREHRARHRARARRPLRRRSRSRSCTRRSCAGSSARTGRPSRTSVPRH